MLTKEECEKACLYLLSHCYETDAPALENGDKDKTYTFTPAGFKESEIFKRLIEEHFTPQSLKFEEIKAGMYVWDNVYESIGRVDRVLTNCNRRRLHNRYSGGGDIVDYEENRYYPIQIPIIGDNNEKHI